MVTPSKPVEEEVKLQKEEPLIKLKGSTKNLSNYGI